MLAEITQLLDLQTTDGQLYELAIQIDRLRHQQAQTEERIAAEEANVDRLRAQLAELEHESRMKNLAVDELDANIRQYQERLDKGIISFKEMEDLRAKIDSERGRISTMEDEALGLMDTIEHSRRELGQAISDCTVKVAEARSQIDDIVNRVSAIETEIDRLEGERETLAERTPPYLLKQYESLHQRSSEPVAVIKNGTCSGCKLKLSGSTIERVRGGMGIVTCEHCSRILYVDDFVTND